MNAATRAPARTVAQTKPLRGRWAAALAASTEGTVLAGCEAGLYRSEDDGVTWTRSDGKLPSELIVHSILAAPGGDLYAYVNLYVVRSADDGLTWKRCESQPGKPGTSGHYPLLAVGGAIYAGTAQGLFRTEDRGDHWKRLAAGPITSLALAPDGAIYAGMELGRVLVGAARGASWKTIAPRAFERQTVGAVMAAADGTVWASAAWQGIFASPDGGATWMQRAEASGAACLVDTGDAIQAVVGSSGIYKTIDGGETWQEMNEGLGLPDNIMWSLLKTPRGALLAGGRFGVHRRVSGGKRWQRALVLDDAGL